MKKTIFAVLVSFTFALVASAGEGDGPSTLGEKRDLANCDKKADQVNPPGDEPSAPAAPPVGEKKAKDGN